MNSYSLFVLLACFSAPAPIDKLTDVQKTELKRFVGLWEYKQTIREGKPREAERLVDLTIEFAENGCFMIKHESRVVGLGRITIDSTKNPKQVDFTYSERGEYDGKLRGTHEVEGIYEIERDAIKFCFNTDANRGPRPTVFRSEPKEETVLEFLQRYNWQTKKPEAPKSTKK